MSTSDRQDLAAQLQRLAYGDGLFETMRGRNGGVALWTHHWDRLERGCRALAIAVPARDAIEAERDELLALAPAVTLKLVLWRKPAGMGYNPAGVQGSHRAWSHLPFVPPHSWPLRVRWCDLRLSIQPRLAGLKTLNRLEQVLARAEWNDERWDEGLLLDCDERVVGAISGNLFARIDGVLTTPPIDRCGVSGTLRAWLIRESAAGHVGPVEVRAILRADIERASELFVTNAIRGIRAVGSVGLRAFETGPVTRAWIGRAQAQGVMDPAVSLA